MSLVLVRSNSPPALSCQQISPLDGNRNRGIRISVQEDCGKLRRRTTSTRSSTATILLVLMLTLSLAAALVGASGPAQTCAHAALARRECLG